LIRAFLPFVAANLMARLEFAQVQSTWPPGVAGGGRRRKQAVLFLKKRTKKLL
jgi:hypothetical protein